MNQTPTSLKVLRACKTPRTIKELQAEIDEPPQLVRYAVYNLCRRDKLTNLCDEERKPGSFVAKGFVPIGHKEPERGDPTLLERAWHGRLHA